MARVLIVGIEPEQVDFSDPALPPGLTADIIRRGVALALEQLADAGHEASHLYIPSDPQGLGVLAETLERESFDCVTVGGGVRLPPCNLALFEAMLNTIARVSPAPAIALVSRPDETPEAVARALR